MTQTVLSPNELLAKVDKIKEVLERRATGQNRPEDDEIYAQLRRELIRLPNLPLPRFILSCSSLNEFWGFIKPQFGSYRERRDYLRTEFEPVWTLLQSELINISDPGGTSAAAGATDLFDQQFPAGLPFGRKKPNLAFVAVGGRQKAHFENDSEIGVIRGSVYPNFTYAKLKSLLSDTPIATQHGLHLPGLLRLCQTELERRFLITYIHTFHLFYQEVPMLVPQAWIQWHSMTKVDLRSIGSSYANELYRVDFVAFWNMKRFAVLIDDISHYAKKVGSRWDADQEAYSKRLKEDRKLRKEGWYVFRASNWEMRDTTAITEGMSDLREMIGF